MQFCAKVMGTRGRRSDKYSSWKCYGNIKKSITPFIKVLNGTLTVAKGGEEEFVVGKNPGVWGWARQIVTGRERRIPQGR